MKKCTKCHVEKEANRDNFYKGVRTKDGLKGHCKECDIEINKKWFKEKDEEYRTWANMKTRCYNKNRGEYKHYGGRGIKVCDRWLNSYDNFIKDVGKKPSPLHSIDRINNDGDYEPNNVKWSTRSEQNINQRIQKSNTSGYVGVHWRKDRKKWRVSISINHKVINLGNYKNKKDAINARKQGEIKYHKKQNTL